LNRPRKIHFIDPDDAAIDLAVSVWELGHVVTLSCSDINTPSASKLLKYSLLPNQSGYFQERITAAIDEVVIPRNMARDNPELKRAIELKLPIKSLADIILEQSIDKQRLVVIGNNGKTTITLMMAHVLTHHKRKFDLAASVSLPGSNHLVKVSDAPIIVVEGQDVMCSPFDATPQFMKYQHHIGVISGIEWQESPQYPTREAYIRQFGEFVGATPKGGVLVYVEFDPVIAVMKNVGRQDILMVPYKTHPSSTEGGKEFLLASSRQLIPLRISGKHNLQCVSAAKETLKRIGITSEMFYEAISSFEGVRN
jgi:UDP-N-acetylmuramate: L-alanyl-gamma-D-glutamyl-meso-diaminopimelate ligase